MGREMRYPFIFYSTVTMTEHWRGIYCRHFLIRSLVPFLCWRDSLFDILFLVRWREILLYCTNASLHCVPPSSKSKSAGPLSQSQRAFIKKINKKKGRVTISRRLLGRTQARGGSVNISYKNLQGWAVWQCISWCQYKAGGAQSKVQLQTLSNTWTS